MGALSLSHILILALILIVLFGPRKIPDLGKAIGKAIRGFKEGMNEIEVSSKDIKDNEKIVYDKEKDKNKS